MDKDVKNTILNMAETQLDEVLQMNGFKRRSNSLIYARKSKESTQKIEIMYFLHPSYYNNALAHIYPQLSVYYPDIQELAKKILGDTIITSGLKNQILRQPIQVYHDSKDWVLYNEKDNITIGENIKDFLVNYSIPLLNDINNIDGYLEAYWNDDKRIIKDDRQHVYFACACALKKDCNGVQREHNKKLNNGLPILHKVPPKRDYGRYFCIMAEKGGTSHGGLTEKLSLFFHAKKQEVNAYGR